MSLLLWRGHATEDRSTPPRSRALQYAAVAFIQSNPSVCTFQVVQTCFGGLEVGSCEPSSPNWLVDFLDVSVWRWSIFSGT